MRLPCLGGRLTCFHATLVILCFERLNLSLALPATNFFCTLCLGNENQCINCLLLVSDNSPGLTSTQQGSTSDSGINLNRLTSEINRSFSLVSQLDRQIKWIGS